MKRFILPIMCAAVLLLIPRPSSALSVSPALVELSGERGSVLETTITLINTSTAEQMYHLGTLKFIPREESGAPTFIPPEVDHSGLPEWIGLFANQVRVPARSRAEVPVTVAIPSDAISGGHYAAVTISDAPHDIVETNGARINATTAVLMLVTVEGETVEEAALLDFTSPESGSVSSLAHASFRYRVQNQGNVHVTPSGSVTLRDLFGRDVTVANANQEEGRILPGSTRTYEGEIGTKAEGGFFQTVQSQWQHFAIGPVTAELLVQYGADGQIQSSFGFWVIPWQLLLTVLVAIGSVLLIIRGMTVRKG